MRCTAYHLSTAAAYSSLSRFASEGLQFSPAAKRASLSVDAPNPSMGGSQSMVSPMSTALLEILVGCLDNRQQASAFLFVSLCVYIHAKIYTRFYCSYIYICIYIYISTYDVYIHMYISLSIYIYIAN